MLLFIGKRLLGAVMTLFAIVTITFFLVRAIPGDPFATEKSSSAEVTQAQREKFHHDKPLFSQYVLFLNDYVHGDLYRSIKYKNWTVKGIIAQAFPVSAFLGFCSFTLAVIVGVVVGAFAATRKGTWIDHVSTASVILGICLPAFVVAPVFILVFALLIHLFPPGGWEGLSSLILPVTVLALPYIAYIARLTRRGVIEAMEQDYVRTARAKGLGEWRVVFVHALRNSIIPVVSFLGPAAAAILTGSFIVEMIFHIPGLGKHFVNSVLNNDVYLVIGTITVYSALLILFNLLVDLGYYIIDPRIRQEGGS